MKKIASIMALCLATSIASAIEVAEADVRSISDAAFDELDAATAAKKPAQAAAKETVAEVESAKSKPATQATAKEDAAKVKAAAVQPGETKIESATVEAATVEVAEVESATVEAAPIAADAVAINEDANADENAVEDSAATADTETESLAADESGEVNEHDANTGTVVDAAAVEEFLDFSGAFFPTIHGTTINSPYGIRRYRLHRGVDLHICIGDSIVAAYPGKVIVSKYNRRGYGHYVMLEHANGTRTLYGHLKKRLVSVGDTVEGGQLVGWGGNTGRSSGPHLHFEIRYGEVNIDPATVFNFEEGRLLENSERYSVAEATESHNAIQKELSKHRIHKIRRGDTLGKIARMYGTTIERLCKLNGIKRTTILQIGHRLRCS